MESHCDLPSNVAKPRQLQRKSNELEIESILHGATRGPDDPFANCANQQSLEIADNVLHSLRVCLKSPRCQSAKHEVGHGEKDHRFAGRGMELVVFAESAIASKPCKGSFDYPSSWQYAKRLLRVTSFHDFKNKFARWLKMACPLEKTTSVPSVCS